MLCSYRGPGLFRRFLRLIEKQTSGRTEFVRPSCPPRVPPRSPLVRGTDDRNASSPPLEARQRELCATAQDPSPGVAASVYRWSSACRLLAGFGSPFAKRGTCLGSQVDDAARTASRKWYTIPTRQNNAPGRPWSCLPTSVRTDAPVHPNACRVAVAVTVTGTVITRD